MSILMFVYVPPFRVLMILLALVGLWCDQASAEDRNTVRVVGITLGGDVNLSRDAPAWSVALGNVQKFNKPGWYGKGWLVSLEYDHEKDFDANQRTETVNVYAGVIYGITERTDFAIALGQGVRERGSDQGGWKSGGNTLINAAVGREFKTAFGINELALTTNYDLDQSEWGIGASFTVLWKY
jgi:hypothetical protein